MDREDALAAPVVVGRGPWRTTQALPARHRTARSLSLSESLQGLCNAWSAPCEARS